MLREGRSPRIEKRLLDLARRRRFARGHTDGSGLDWAEMRTWPEHCPFILSNAQLQPPGGSGHTESRLEGSTGTRKLAERCGLWAQIVGGCCWPTARAVAW